MPNVSNSIRPDWSRLSRDDMRSRVQQIKSPRALADFWGVETYQLTYYAYHADKRESYRTFTIPRRRVGWRRIEAPKPTLKYIQRLIHETLTRVYGPSTAVHGFVPKRSVVSNANFHLGRRYILNVDLEDFFPSITRRRIYSRLIGGPYLFNSRVAHLIAALSTNVYARLPQGSPSSPVIANIIAAGLDTDLTRLCAELSCRYTRYADDITISTSRNEIPPPIARYPNARGTGQVALGDRLLGIIENHGFKVNFRKTCLLSYGTRQLCTGLIVNGSRPSPPRKYVRNLRSLIHHWHKHGWEHVADTLHSKENRPRFQTRQRLLDHVMGKIGYIRMARGPDDPVAMRLEQSVRDIPPGR